MSMRKKLLKPKQYKSLGDSGFTLVETIVYAALISIVIGMIVVVAFQVISGNSNLSEKIFLEEEANFLLRKIEWVIGGASSINSPNSGNSSNSSLSVDKFGFTAGENPVVFNISEGNITIERGSGDPVTLNSAFVKIENATFTHIAASSSTPAGIKVELSVKNTGSPGTREYSLTSYLRQ